MVIFLCLNFLLFFFINTNTSQQLPSEPISLEYVEGFIENVIKDNETLLDLLNPSIHTKKGLEEIINCIKKELFVENDPDVECTHPAIVKPDTDLLTRVEHSIPFKYSSYDEKIIHMSSPLYKFKTRDNTNRQKELETYNKQTILLYFYLLKYIKNGKI